MDLLGLECAKTQSENLALFVYWIMFQKEMSVSYSH